MTIVGHFVTTGFGTAEKAAFEAENDDYSSIMVKALADDWQKLCRILHQAVRQNFWGMQSMKICLMKN